MKRTEKYGLGDYRPEFGAFNVSLEFIRIENGDLRVNGNKARDEKVEKANATRAKKLMTVA